MKKELFDLLIEDTWQLVKDAMERSYYAGKKEAREELILEAHALIKASEVKANPDNIAS